MYKGNSTNATTVNSSGFNEEYVVFNYIMVGVSCGILLVVIIIAKLLCIFNRNADYDNLNSSTSVDVGEKTLFHADDLQNITEEIKRSSPPVTNSVFSRRPPASVYPRSPTSTYYHDVDLHSSSGSRGVWHTQNHHSNELDDDDFFVSHYDTQRLDIKTPPIRLSNTNVCSKSAPVDNVFLDQPNRKRRISGWPRQNPAHAVNTSAPDFTTLPFPLSETQT